MRNSAEIIGIMPSGFKNSELLAFPVDRHLEVSPGSVYSFLQSGGSHVFTCFKKVFYLAEEPRISNTRPANHGTIESVTVAHFHGFFGSIHITISKHRNVHTRIVLYFGDRRPVGRSFIHLRAGAAVNGDGFGTRVLKPFGHLNDSDGIFIPAKTGFYGNR